MVTKIASIVDCEIFCKKKPLRYSQGRRLLEESEKEQIQSEGKYGAKHGKEKIVDGISNCAIGFEAVVAVIFP